jgi:hypothetical protein
MNHLILAHRILYDVALEPGHENNNILFFFIAAVPLIAAITVWAVIKIKKEKKLRMETESARPDEKGGGM